MMGYAAWVCSNEDFAELARRSGARAASRLEHGRPSCKQMKIDIKTSTRITDPPDPGGAMGEITLLI